MKNIEKSIEYNECMKIYKIFKSKYILKMCILKINKYKNLEISITLTKSQNLFSSPIIRYHFFSPL